MRRRLEHSVTVRRTPEEVFAFLADFAQNPRWESGVVAVRQSPPGLVAVGTTLDETRRFMGRTVQTTYEVTAFEPNRCIELRSTGGPVGVCGRYTIEPDAAGARVTDTAEFEAHGLFKLAGPLFARMAKRTVVRNFTALQRELEAQRAI